MGESTTRLEDLTPVRKRLQVEVPAGAVQAELDRAFQQVGQREPPARLKQTILDAVARPGDRFGKVVVVGSVQGVDQLVPFPDAGVDEDETAFGADALAEREELRRRDAVAL